MKRTYSINKCATADEAVKILFKISGELGRFRIDDLSHDKWDDTSVMLPAGTKLDKVLEETKSRTADVIGVSYYVSGYPVYVYIRLDKEPDKITVATEESAVFEIIEKSILPFIK